MTFAKRRYLGLTLLLLLSAVCGLVNDALTTQLHHAALFSGSALLAVLLLLTLFNARKKLPFLPILKASTWMQIHIYVGLLSLVLFGLHLHGRIPQGTLEFTLAVLYLAVFLSGLVGLALSRWLPARLTMHGETVIYERIPAMCAAIQREAEELVEQSVGATNSSTIADFYEARLRQHFARPPILRSLVPGFRGSLFTLLAEVEALDRFLNAAERETMGQLVRLIQAKDNLDVQMSGQRLLKLWLFVHIPLTYGLLLFAIVHAVMAFTLS